MWDFSPVKDVGGMFELCGGGKLQENPCLGLWPLAGGFLSKEQDGKYVSFEYWTRVIFGGEVKF